MIQEIIIRKQTPSVEGNWLYRFDENSNRYFISQCVYLGKDDTQWAECNEEQKLEYEKHNEEQDAIEREKNETER